MVVTEGLAHMLSNSCGRFGKRLVDLMVAVPALLVLLPIFGLIAVLVRLESCGPVFFVQQRLGKKGRIFFTYKFRTMFDEERTRHEEIVGKTDEVTSVGYWLRRFKVDELPQLINVIKGDMSLVGPRPALPAQLEEYNDLGRQRLRVRPGLTGLAQVNGNIHLTWPERWTYDATYVQRQSFALDFGILLRTVAVIVIGEEKFLKRPNVESPA